MTRTPVPPAASPRQGVFETDVAFQNRRQAGPNAPAAPLRQGVFETDVAFQNRRQAAPADAPEQDPAAARAAAAPAANAITDQYTTTVRSMEAVKDRIAKEVPWIENPLSGYQSYTYHFRLFVAQDYDYLVSLNEGDREGEIKPGDVFRAIDSNPMRIIAESGVTTGFNIQEVKIESLVGPNMETQNTNATQFVIQIQEPLGTSFVELMRNAAVDLNIRNMDKCPYFLELTFMGYNEQGDLVGQIDPATPVKSALLTDEYDNGGRWLYQIKITNIETELTASGSNYTVTALPYSEEAFDPAVGCSPAFITPSGRTIKEFLADLKAKLDLQWENYFSLPEIYKFDFVVHPDADNDPNNYQLVSPTPDLEENRNDRWEPGANVPMMSVPIGMEISAIIESAFAQTHEAQTRARNVLRRANAALSAEDAAAATENQNGMSSVALYRAAKLFRIEPDVEIIGYNYDDNFYRKHITFHIWPFFSQAPVLSRTLANEARRPEVQSLLFNELIDRGFFRKKYDYIFTGNNIEVTRLDIRFNLAWSAVLPALSDYHQKPEDAITHARRAEEEPERPTPSNDADAPIPAPTGTPTEERAVEARKDQIADLGAIREEELKLSRLPDDSPERPALVERIAEMRREMAETSTAEFNYNRTQLRGRYERNRLLEEEADSKRRRGPDKQYLEDLEETPAFAATGSNLEPLAHNISFSRPNSQTTNRGGTGYAVPVGGERGVYGAVLEQMYGPLTTGLINIDLEIRGDPYWISHSNVERRLHFLSNPPPLTPASKMAAYMEGDNVFMLEFSYPFNIDSETGDINIRDEVVGDNDTGAIKVERLDRFTGLYRVVRVTNTFSGGEFRQTLKSQRFPLLDLARAMQFDGFHAGGALDAGSASTNQAARDSTSPAPSRSAPGGPPANTNASGEVPNNQAALARSLDPQMARVVARAQEIDAAAGGGFRIGSEGGRRTQDQQARIVGRGNSSRLNSHHLTGRAVDVLPIDSQGRTIPGWANGNDPAYARISRSMAQASRELGIPITWGGNFSNPANAAAERSHYELRRN